MIYLINYPDYLVLMLKTIFDLRSTLIFAITYILLVLLVPIPDYSLSFRL